MSDRPKTKTQVSDGYEVIGPQRKHDVRRGVQCGTCGLRIDRGQNTSNIRCGQPECPLGLYVATRDDRTGQQTKKETHDENLLMQRRGGDVCEP